MNKLTYKIFSDNIRQKTITFNLTNIPNSEIYTYITEEIYKKFGIFGIKINHAGKTIRISE